MGTSVTFSNLVLHYPFDDTVTTDTSGSSNTGIISGSGTTLVSGQIGSALSFNGNGYVAFTSVASLGLPTQTSPFSASLWVKTTATTAAIVALRNGGNGILHFGIGFNGASGNNGSPTVLLQADSAIGGAQALNSTTLVNDNNWHHLAFTRTTGQVLTIYIDGVLDCTSTDTIGGGITPLLADANIGKDVLNGAITPIVGLLDDLQIYSRALTSTEIGSIHTSGAITGFTYQLNALFAGNGALTALLGRRQSLTTPAFAAIAAVQVALLQSNKLSLSANYSVTGSLQGSLRALQALTQVFTGAGALQATAAMRSGIGATFAGSGAASASLTQAGVPQARLLSATFAGTGGWQPTWYLAYVKAIHYPTRIAISANFNGVAGLQIDMPDAIYNRYMTTDPVNPGIYPTAGSEVLYRQAAGLEKAMADVDAGRLIATYAELVRDQWDPWAISYRNLGYLAWAQGVNLWEDDWAEPQRRQWVASQWTFKYYRGSDLGMKMAVEAVDAKLKNLIRPPALFYPGPAQTDAERQAYYARFPQLRLYPYAPRPQLPWLNYMGGKTLDPQGNPIYVKNGRFLGPYRPFYPTNYNAGGLYLRKCTLYEPRTGLETQLTVRTISAVAVPGTPATIYDEVTLPANTRHLFYPGENAKRFLFPLNTPVTVSRNYAAILGHSNVRVIRVPRDTKTEFQFQATFNTILPSLQPINVRPELVHEIHPMRPTEFYCGQPLRKKFFPKSNAWQHLYERWYLFDPTRQPDQRWARTYMGRARFGIPKYSAKAIIDAPFHWPNTYVYAGRFIGKGWYFPPKNTKRIDQVRRAVTAAMALRDTVVIDTKVRRPIQFADITVLDGTFSFGQYVISSW